MQHPRSASATAALLAFPELAPPEERPVATRRLPRDVHLPETVEPDWLPPEALGEAPQAGKVRAHVLSFQNMHLHGDLLVNFLRARKRVFIDKLHWSVPQTEGMEFDQYDNPQARWIVIHEYGEVLGGVRLLPTTAQCGIYSYMLRDAQKGLLHDIPRDVLFFEAPVSPAILEASRLFITDEVPAQRRLQVQAVLMDWLARTGREMAASHVIGIVPAVWSRWLRRLDLDAIPVGPRFAIDGTASQAALFKTQR